MSSGWIMVGVLSSLVVFGAILMLNELVTVLAGHKPWEQPVRPRSAQAASPVVIKPARNALAPKALARRGAAGDVPHRVGTQAGDFRRQPPPDEVSFRPSRLLVSAFLRWREMLVRRFSCKWKFPAAWSRYLLTMDRRPRYFIMFFLILCAELRAEEPWKPLWNGRDLSDWTTWMQRPEPGSEVPGMARGADGKYTEAIGSHRDPLKVFTVTEVDGKPAIRISGEAFGEMRSRESFEDYRLRLQFKWGVLKWPPRDEPETPRDSGLLYHVHAAPGAEGRVWARSIELQIQERDVGDLYAVGSEISVRSTPRIVGEHTVFDYDPKGEWHVFSQVPKKEGRCVKQPDNENPTGEWNTVEIVCLGEDSIHIVNGKVVMRLHAPRRIDKGKPEPVTAGPVILQSEGAEIFYRDIEYKPITVIPPEFAE